MAQPHGDGDETRDSIAAKLKRGTFAAPSGAGDGRDKVGRPLEPIRHHPREYRPEYQASRP